MAEAASQPNGGPDRRGVLECPLCGEMAPLTEHLPTPEGEGCSETPLGAGDRLVPAGEVWPR